MRTTALLAALLSAACLLGGCVGSDGGPGDGSGPGPGSPAFSDPVCAGTLQGIDLLNATYEDLQRGLSDGTLTSAGLVEAYLARIAAFDAGGPGLNSVRHVNAKALEEARALDAERAGGTVRGPLHGIPILLKDNVGTRDMPTTAGSIALALNVPPEDATLTARLRAAGAILLGKTNLSEFANWDSQLSGNGYSSLGGQVVNAYTFGDPSGSSSGSGVAGSMAFAAGTVGTETSGSILSPSLDNSLVGVKPTMGLVSRFGIIPLAENFDVPGPMVRNVADAAAMLNAMAGEDPQDPATQGTRFDPPSGYVPFLRTDALQGVRIGYVPSSEALFEAALEVLEGQGAVLVPLEEDAAQQVSVLELGVIFNEFKFGINDYLANHAGPGLPVSDLTGIIVYNQANWDGVFNQELLIASDASPGLQPLADAAALPVITAARQRADAMFTENGIAATVALGPDFISLGAAAGYPTVAVPAGYSGSMPRGLTFFGPAWSEGPLLSFAFAYEQAAKARLPPPLVNEGLLDGVCDGQGGGSDGGGKGENGGASAGTWEAGLGAGSRDSDGSGAGGRGGAPPPAAARAGLPGRGAPA